ncbi:MAG: PAS domain S-box protein, partial [Thermodesulfobacteriota bacterium]|nr:PAS domain S-box protein [Thermodesulfobacteriota bacterium]
RDGREIPIDDSAAPIKDDKGNIIGVVLVFRDITERKMAEEALSAEKERLNVTLRSIGDGVIATDVNGEIVLMNRVAEELTGYTQQEAVGNPLSVVFHIVNEKTRKPCENHVDRVLETGGITGLANHTLLIARDGTERILSDSGSPILDKDGKIIGVVLVFRDITSKYKIEEELQKIQKLESIGFLAGGIAHDFNNILTGILGNITLAKMYSSPEGKVFSKLIQAEKASLRAKDLTQQLLTFSRGGAPVKEVTSIKELIKDNVNFALRGSNVRCEFKISEDLWPVEIDKGQISQVINNIVINADQAMPEGGIIRVWAENITIGTQDQEQGLPLQGGKYIKLSIKDQGMGITQEYLQKIFDPYFSTKQKGSGLGLSTSYSIIKKHDGHIIAESEMGVGTTLYIYLPASEKKLAIKEKVVDIVPEGEGKILLMDDEDDVLEVTGEIIKSFGYEVEFARDGEEALRLYKKAKKSATPFNAVIIDLIIPGGMGGKETIEKLLKIDPDAKAIVSSGYSNDPIMADYKKYGFSAVITKPYKVEEMGKVINKVIKS